MPRHTAPRVGQAKADQHESEIQNEQQRGAPRAVDTSSGQWDRTHHSRVGRAGCRARPMQFRVVTLNLEQDHKRWSDRHPLISAEIAGLRPDVIALNEVCVPLQTARLLRDTAITGTGIPYKLVQQTRVNGLSKVEGEALLTRFAIVETGNLD